MAAAGFSLSAGNTGPPATAGSVLPLVATSQQAGAATTMREWTTVHPHAIRRPQSSKHVVHRGSQAATTTGASQHAGSQHAGSQRTVSQQTGSQHGLSQ